MRVARAIIIPAIVSLSAAGSILTGSAAPAATAHAPTAQVHVVAISAVPLIWYRG